MKIILLIVAVLALSIALLVPHLQKPVSVPEKFVEQPIKAVEQPISWGQTDEKALETLTTTTNRDTRFWATWNLRGNREELVAKLMEMLNEQYSDNVKMDLSVVLGDYRVAEAVPFIVEHLEWDDVPPAQVSKDVWFRGRIPNVVLDALDIPMRTALEKIGLPAIPALLNKISQTENPTTITKCVSICEVIEGKRVTQFRLQEILGKETDQKKKVRIQSALEALNNLKVEK